MMTEAELALAAMSSAEDRAGDPLATLFQRLAEAAGDEQRREPLAELYDRCASELYGHALWRCGDTTLAADVVHDVFVKLAGRGRSLASVRKPRRYLFAMVHRRAVDHHRRRRPTEPLGEDSVLAYPACGDERVDARRAARLLARLPARQREVLYLRFYADLTFAEIGAVVGVSTFTAASRCRLGLRRLRRWLGQCGPGKENG
jgi:RNA polymerase sigma-70 factor (ECF subfamily)